MSSKEEKEENVSFIEDDGETVVDFSEKDESKPDPVAERLARAEEETARLRSEIQQSRQQQYNIPQNQSDPYDSELEAIDERSRALAVQWEMDKVSGRLRDKSVADEYDRKARELDHQKAAVASKKAMRDVLPQVMREQQLQQLRAQYSDVYNNQQAITYAQGAYQMMLARGE